MSSPLFLCAEVDAVAAGAVFKQLDGYGTCMWLDLKPDCDRQRLARQLGDISPFMLLNLRQLRWVVKNLSATLYLMRKMAQPAQPCGC